MSKTTIKGTILEPLLASLRTESRVPWGWDVGTSG